MQTPHIDHIANIQEKLKQLTLHMPCASYIRQAGLIPHIVPFSSATLWRFVHEGRFPAPYKLAPRITAWKVDEVMAWAAMAPKLRVHKHKAKQQRQTGILQTGGDSDAPKGLLAATTNGTGATKGAAATPRG